jgi:putative oxygen-independent coproporphyrinogen III oxidase
MPPLGVYIHFPWCLKKCPYCDFVSFARARDQIDHAGYADAVLAELARRRGAFEGRRLSTIFFGGGTPSLWEPAELGRVLRAVLAAAGESAPDVEVTVECNPSSLDEARARALRDEGVGRLSVGVQALDAGRLEFLGRLHDAEGGLAAVMAALRAGVPRVSADLIYGVATGPEPPSPAEAAAEAARVARTGVSHLSAYSLTIEPGTAFGEMARRGKLPIAPDDAVADAFFAVEEALEAQGFVHYEISNYARPGDEARHNLGYWRGADYLGLGCAAFGTLSTGGGRALRYRNIVEPGRYTAAALLLPGGGGAPLEAEQEELDPEMRLRERIMLGLRLLEGVDLGAAEADLGVQAWTPARRRAADRLAGRGRLEVEAMRLRIPRGARIWTDGVAAELF